MKVRYPRRKIWTNVIIGLLWFGWSILKEMENEEQLFDYVFAGLGLIYFGLALYMAFAPYVSITNTHIIKHNLKPIKIAFSDIEEIDKHIDRTKITSANKTMRILRTNVRKKQREALKAEIERIEQEYGLQTKISE